MIGGKFCLPEFANTLDAVQDLHKILHGVRFLVDAKVNREAARMALLSLRGVCGTMLPQSALRKPFIKEIDLLEGCWPSNARGPALQWRGVGR